MINFSSAFDSAWERMMIILFRPFDLGKWFLMGVGAFLAGLISGGNGANFNPSSFYSPGSNTSSNSHSNWNFNYYSSNNLHTYSLGSLLNGWETGVVVGVCAVVFVLLIALFVLFYWLSSHGEFIFLDNLVRNRGAVSWPWSHYAGQANSLFLAYLVFLGLGFTILIPFALVGLIMAWPLIQSHSWPHQTEIIGFVVLTLAYLFVALGFSIFFFIFRAFGVPLMFRNSISARAAFVESMRLAQRHSASVAVFVLLRIALWVGLAILSVPAVCCTCCIGGLPYIGTVLLLPPLVYIRCFTLDCLAQFGPEYNVWTVDVPPAPEPVTPLPPLG